MDWEKTNTESAFVSLHELQNTLKIRHEAIWRGFNKTGAVITSLSENGWHGRPVRATQLEFSDRL
jgi:hypothetical protein